MADREQDLKDGISLLKHIANGGLSRSQFPIASAAALLLRFEALEVELRKYDPEFPGIMEHGTAPTAGEAQ